MIPTKDFAHFLKLVELKHLKTHDTFQYTCQKCKTSITRETRSIKHKPQWCPVCAGKHVVPGINDIFSQASTIAKEYSKHNEKAAQEIYFKSNEQVNWICSTCGNQWSKMSPAQRVTQRQNCPYCSNRRFLKGFNDLTSRYPAIITKKWDNTKNIIKPNETYGKANEKFWWICDEQHSYKRTIHKELKHGCPICSSHVIIPGVNDFLHYFPKLEKEWSSNNKTDPHVYSKNSPYKALWICSNNHEYKTSIGRRVKGGGNCPYCMNRKLLKNFNDLKTKNPKIASEWNYTKNHARPEEIIYGSSQQVWWKCQKDHEWKTSLSLRISQNTQCPKCKDSQIEQEIFAFLQTLQKDFSQHDRKTLNGIEIDALSLKTRIGIEVNGDFWHSEKWIQKKKNESAKNYHLRKQQIAQQKGITLLFVWESDWKTRKEDVQTALKRVIADSNDIDPLLTILSKG